LASQRPTTLAEADGKGMARRRDASEDRLDCWILALSIYDFRWMLEMLLVHDLCGSREAGLKGGGYELGRRVWLD